MVSIIIPNNRDKYLEEPLFNYRKHNEQASNTTDNHQLLRENTIKINNL